MVYVALGAGVISLATGCGSTQSAKQVIVCPQCRVAIEHVSNGRPGRGQNTTRDEFRHSCSGGCQSAMVTLLKDGKWEHRCSACAQTPYTCPLVHPITDNQR